MLDSEVEFHNKRAEKEAEGEGRLTVVYQSMANALTLPREMLPESASCVLEIGSYLGDNSTGIDPDVKYTGIDISDAAVQHANRLYAMENISFFCVDAHKITALNEQYDYVYGNGILHHLSLEKFIPVLSKVLRPESSAVFLEPNAGPPWLRLFRFLTPWLRSPDEHPLTERDYDLFREYFHVQIINFGLLCPLLPMLCLNSRRVIRWCQDWDTRLNKTSLSKWSWLSVVILTPLKHKPDS